MLRRCEAYLHARGARAMQAGQRWPLNPFYLGLYGGSDSPGFLRSDSLAEPFFRRHRYQVRDVVLVMQRKLNQALKAPDPRFAWGSFSGPIDRPPPVSRAGARDPLPGRDHAREA